MQKKLIYLLVAIMLLGLSACGKKVDQISNSELLKKDTESVTEESATDNIDVNDTSSNYYVPEKDEDSGEVVLHAGVDHSKATKDMFIDENTITEEVNEDIYFLEDTDVYMQDGIVAGHVKADVTAKWLKKNDEWSIVEFNVGKLFMKTVDIENKTGEKPKTNVSDTPSFTVTDMNKTMYATSAVNVRAFPNTSSNKLGTLSMNQKVDVTGKIDNGWYRISFNGGEAYVSGSYLSDSKVPTGDNNGNNGNNGGNTNGGTVTPTPQPTPIPTPEPIPTPPVYTPEEVISAMKSAFLEAGLQWYPDTDLYASAPEAGPTGGMGWGEVPVGPGELESKIEGGIQSALWGKNKYFYIEYVEMRNNKVVLRVYFGGQNS